MSYSRWGHTWPGGDESWYIFEDMEGYLCLWPPGGLASLSETGAEHLYHILGDYLENHDVPLSLTERERAEYEEMKKNRDMRDSLFKSVPLALRLPEFATKEEKAAVKRGDRTAYIKNLEAALELAHEEVESWRRRCFVSEEAALLLCHEISSTITPDKDKEEGESK